MSQFFIHWQVASKENEDSNPEFKRVLAERAKRLERVSNVTEIYVEIQIQNEYRTNTKYIEKKIKTNKTNQNK